MFHHLTNNRPHNFLSPPVPDEAPYPPFRYAHEVVQQDTAGEVLKFQPPALRRDTSFVPMPIIDGTKELNALCAKMSGRGWP